MSMTDQHADVTFRLFFSKISYAFLRQKGEKPKMVENEIRDLYNMSHIPEFESYSRILRGPIPRFIFVRPNT